MIAILGIGGLAGHWEVFKALNPMWAIRLITQHPGGFWLLGGIFLCTTGAEALYSDLGHCGRKNIQISWLYVKTCLVLSYFGQSAWLLQHVGKELTDTTPFYGMVPEWFLLPCIGIATLATIIASQALISGSFTLVAEAIRLNLWPKMRVVFPTDENGQVYIPSINLLLMVGCCAMVLHFKESAKMEAAFGLSVTLTMLMTTILLSFYLFTRKINKLFIFSLLFIFLTIECSFLIANLKKFPEGGWITMMIGVLLFFVMYTWFRAHEIKRSLKKFVDIKPYLPVLKELSNDQSVPKYATNLVYLTSSNNQLQIEDTTIYSILYKQPKRADIYWFVHVDVMDEPYTMSYTVKILEPEEVVSIVFKLGFRIAPKVNLLFRKVVEEMVLKKEVNIQSRYCSLDKHNITGDFRFVIMQSFLSFENELSFKNNFVLKTYFLLKKISLPDEKEYGLDYSNVTIEKTPLIVSSPKIIHLARE
jgi:KUP system potassium uptake protein